MEWILTNRSNIKHAGSPLRAPEEATPDASADLSTLRFDPTKMPQDRPEEAKPENDSTPTKREPSPERPEKPFEDPVLEPSKEEAMEVEDVEIDGVTYLTSDKTNGDIYKLDDDGDILEDENGDWVKAGYFKDGISFFI